MTSKETFLKIVEAQEKEWKAKKNDLESKAATFDAHTRMEFDKQIESLQSKLKEAEQKADEFKNTSNEKWQEVSEKINDSWDEMTSNVNDLISKIKSKND